MAFLPLNSKGIFWETSSVNLGAAGGGEEVGDGVGVVTAGGDVGVAAEKGDGEDVFAVVAVAGAEGGGFVGAGAAGEVGGDVVGGGGVAL